MQTLCQGYTERLNSASKFSLIFFSMLDDFKKVILCYYSYENQNNIVEFAKRFGTIQMVGIG